MDGMKAVHVPGLAARMDEWFHGPDDTPAPRLDSGQFEVETQPNGQRVFWFVCPGCRTIAPLPLRPVVNAVPQSWDFNDDLQAPTLSPSINHVGCWHGWLTAGEYTAC